MEKSTVPFNEACRPLLRYVRLGLEQTKHRFLRILLGADDDVITCEMAVKERPIDI